MLKEFFRDGGAWDVLGGSNAEGSEGSICDTYTYIHTSMHTGINIGINLRYACTYIHTYSIRACMHTHIHIMCLVRVKYVREEHLWRDADKAVSSENRSFRDFSTFGCPRRAGQRKTILVFLNWRICGCRAGQSKPIFVFLRRVGCFQVFVEINC
jgi:hypothetical protein